MTEQIFELNADPLISKSPSLGAARESRARCALERMWSDAPCLDESLEAKAGGVSVEDRLPILARIPAGQALARPGSPVGVNRIGIGSSMPFRSSRQGAAFAEPSALGCWRFGAPSVAPGRRDVDITVPLPESEVAWLMRHRRWHGIDSDHARATQPPSSSFMASCR